MLVDLGLTHPDAAQLLHVSLRTLQNWLSGRHQIPYMAYKLLRLLRYMELPGKAWAGWYFSRGQLVTPEGRTINGSDGSWWSLLVRQAHGFGELYRLSQSAMPQSVVVPCGCGFAVRPKPQAGRREAPLDLSNKHFGWPYRETEA